MSARLQSRGSVVVGFKVAASLLAMFLRTVIASWLAHAQSNQVDIKKRGRGRVFFTNPERITGRGYPGR